MGKQINLPFIGIIHEQPTSCEDSRSHYALAKEGYQEQIFSSIELLGKQIAKDFGRDFKDHTTYEPSNKSILTYIPCFFWDEKSQRGDGAVCKVTQHRLSIKEQENLEAIILYETKNI